VSANASRDGGGEPGPDRAATLRRELVEALRGYGLRSERVAAAFGVVPREAFVPDVAASRGLEAVYRDEALPAKVDEHGRWLSSSSQPQIMALMLEQLDLEPGQRVLEIGAGTGYNAALLRHIVGPTGQVTTVEVDAELARRARLALRASGYHARVVVGDGRVEFAPGAPFDRIVVTASSDAIPNAWLDQLRPGGRLQLPLRFDVDVLPQAIATYELGEGTLRSVAMTWGGFMPLHGGDGGRESPGDSASASLWTKQRPALLAQVSGPGLQRLSLAARRRLLALLLAEPRAREPGGVLTERWPAPHGLLLYLALRAPRARLIEVHEPGVRGIGILAADGNGATVASFPIDKLARDEPPSAAMLQPRRRRWWLASYGDADPAPELMTMLADWRRLVHSHRKRFQIVAQRSSASNAEIDFRWSAS
jgi:protein-L-isoaspartate(D-aspartate) O-methyltransferase